MAAKAKAVDPGKFVPGMGQPVEEEPVYSKEEVIEQNKVVALNSQKHTILQILYQEKLAVNAPTIVTNTLLYIMADYGFVQLTENQEAKKDVS